MMKSRRPIEDVKSVHALGIYESLDLRGYSVNRQTIRQCV